MSAQPQNKPTKPSSLHIWNMVVAVLTVYYGLRVINGGSSVMLILLSPIIAALIVLDIVHFRRKKRKKE